MREQAARAAPPIAALLILAVAVSQITVDLWQHRDAPDPVKWAIVLGGAAMAALGVLGASLLARR